jgi:hypothetical protein
MFAIRRKGKETGEGVEAEVERDFMNGLTVRYSEIFETGIYACVGKRCSGHCDQRCRVFIPSVGTSDAL